MRTSTTGPYAMTLVEECSGIGELSWRGGVLAGIRYRVSRFQGYAPSGMPVPGVHRIEGRIEAEAVPDLARLVDSDFTLRLADGRSMRLTLLGEDGRVLAQGHGPSRCSCC